MLTLAGLFVLPTVLLCFVDQCIMDTSIDFSQAARVLMILAALLVGLNLIAHPEQFG